MDLDDFEAETDALRRDLEERQQRRLAGCELPTWPLPEPETPPMSRNTTGFDAVAAQRPAPRPHQRATPALSVPVLEAVMREVGHTIAALDKRLKAAEERCAKLEAENLDLMRKLIQLTEMISAQSSSQSRGLEELKQISQAHYAEIRRMFDGQSGEREFLPAVPRVPRLS